MKFKVIDEARRLLIDKSIECKNTPISLMESGDCDFEVQQSLFDKYVSYRFAADSLTGFGSETLEWAGKNQKKKKTNDEVIRFP